MRRRASYLGLGAAAIAGAAYVARRRGDEGSPLAKVEGGERTKVETSDGAVLDVHVAGDGPAAVLPHCWTGTMEVWAPVAAKLVASGHRVIRSEEHTSELQSLTNLVC